MESLLQALSTQSLPPLLVSPLCQLVSHIPYFSDSCQSKSKSEWVKDIHQLWVRLRGLLIKLTCSSPTSLKPGLDEETGLVIASLLELMDLLERKFPVHGNFYEISHEMRFKRE